MKKTICIIALWSAIGIASAQAQTSSGIHWADPRMTTKTDPTWESINQRGYPKWFSDAKLGIFIHWGLYSVPAYASKEGYAEWFYRGIMTDDSARAQVLSTITGDPVDSIFSNPIACYSKLTGLWKAELWDPDEWAALFKESGARYVLLVTKHHDGYCLWDSPENPNWNSVTSGPRRNIVEDLTRSVRNKGLKMGFYYSLPEWTNARHIWMQDDDRKIENYVQNHMIPQFKDLISRYRPEVLFTDGEWNNTAEEFHAEELISYYYNTVGPTAICNDRWGNGCEHGFLTPEYSDGISVTNRPWAECRGLGRSFGLNRNEDPANYLSSEALIQHFVQLVAAGGGMILNVGPAADGKIPLIQQERLRDLGRWLNRNGKAIYGTHPWKKAFQTKEGKASFTSEEAIDHDWVRNSPAQGISSDHFKGYWEGIIESQYSEDYTFELEVDDNATIWLDGDTLIHYEKNHPDGSQSNAQSAHNWGRTTATRHLSKGEPHQLKVKYEEVDKEAMIHLKWRSKSQPSTPIKPTSPFFTYYTCEVPEICYTADEENLYAIALGWPGKTLVLKDIAQEGRTPSVHLLSSIFGDRLPAEYVGSDLVIDLSSVPYSLISDQFNTFVFEITY